MATIRQKLADYGERFKEICGILSDKGMQMQVTHRKDGYVLSMDGQTIRDHLSDNDLKSVLSAMWLMAGVTDTGAAIASLFVLKHYPDFQVHRIW